MGDPCAKVKLSEVHRARYAEQRNHRFTLHLADKYILRAEAVPWSAE